MTKTFPGGKFELNEDYESCLKIELLEKLNLNVEIDGYFDSHIHNYKSYTIELIAFICRSNQNDIILNEHDKVEWVHIQDIFAYKLAPADIPITEKLIKI